VRRLSQAGVIALLIFAAACGSNTPGAPSGTSTAATISGSIVAPGGSGGGGSTAGYLAEAVPSGLVVTVAGTSIASHVTRNHFSLEDVPEGDVQLLFTAPGFNGSLGIASVRRAEKITLGVSLDGSTLGLESQRRTTGASEQVEGRVESLPPSTAPLSLIVAGRAITTNADTKFFLGDQQVSFAALAIGQRVHVEGQVSGPSLLATTIQIQNTNTEIPVEINGIVADFTGTAASFQFRIDGRLIQGDAFTQFFGGSVFANLANGKRAEVKGLQRNGFVLATRIHVNTEDEIPGSGESASIEGPLTSKSGSVPALTLLVGGVTVVTNASTEVRRRGDVQTLDVLTLGMTLHVVGTRQPDSSLVARMIQIKDDDVGGVFEISGSAGGVKGACPSLTFGVNGYDIVTDASTVFVPACAGLKSGDKVTVKGVILSGRTVKATQVTRQ
jgi:hypothetical protein